MLLLNTTSITLRRFDDESKIPPYAVLSHTWGSDEITFQDMQSGDPGRIQSRTSYPKIEGCCRQALCDGLDHVWIDTCCIDKTSSAELSEAINSMFRWYMNAETCYAYLADVPGGGADSTPVEKEAVFRSSRWFTRGWTLQELLAPREVQLFDAEWFQIGSKRNLDDLPLLERITSIGRRFLQNADELKRASVAQRMSWASGRRTTRVEDQAYCLLGIFDINMPLLYGEGDRAFVRLQQEIMKRSDDQSLFSWGLGLPLDDDHLGHGGLFARSPAAFAHGNTVQFWGQLSAHRPSHYTMTNKGLWIDLPLLSEGPENDTVYAVLDCMSNTKFVAVPLSRAHHDVFQRTRGSAPRTISRPTRKRAVNRLVYIQEGSPPSTWIMYFSTFTVTTRYLRMYDYRLVDAYPPHAVQRIQEDSVRCGDSPRVVLVFQHQCHPRKRVAVLLVVTYSTDGHHMSRPQLEKIEASIGIAPRLNRLTDLVLKRGLHNIERHVVFSHAIDVLGDLVEAKQRPADKQTGAMVDLFVKQDTSRPASQLMDEQESDSDGYEYVSMAAIDAMFNDTSRERLAALRRQNSMRSAFYMKKWVLIVAGAGGALAAVVAWFFGT